MNRLREILRRLSMLLHRREFDNDLADEMRLHLQLREEENLAKGISPDDALSAARRRFGNSTSLRERSHVAWGWEWFENLAQDVRFGARMLRKTPGFTVVSILTLALGIGANTAIFSLMDTVMLRLLPVQRPEELVQLAAATKGFGRGPRTVFTNPMWEAIRSHQDVFAGAFAWGDAQFNLATGGVANNALGTFVSGGYFQTLGVRPAAGRLITLDDDKRGCPGVAVLGYSFWQRRYNGAPVVGNSISIDDHPMPIVGVAGPGFYGTEVGRAFDVAIPLCAEAAITGKRSTLDARSAWWIFVMARRNPGVSEQQSDARLAVLSPAIFKETVPLNWTPADQQRFLNWKLATLPGGAGQSYLRRAYKLALETLMGIAAFVLLLACVNITSMMLARAAARAREVAVRLSLGASRMRLVRQLLTESVMLSCSGALLGVLFAQWGSRLIIRYISTPASQISLDLTIDTRVLAFTTATAILTGILFGVLPAFRATRLSLSATMKGAATNSSQPDTRFHAGRWTASAQVALSLVLVVTAGLFLRSFTKLVTLDIGFDRTNVLQASVDFSSAKLTPMQVVAARQNLERRLRTLPGVIAASDCVIPPVSNMFWDDYIVVEGPNAPKGEDRDAYMNSVSPGYFATLRIAMLAGRDFDEHDAPGGAQVAIVNQKLARKFFGAANPLGKTFRMYETATKLGAPVVIVGVVQDAKYEAMREEIRPTAYFPVSQAHEAGDHYAFEIRTATPPSQLEPAVEQAVVAVSKSAAIRFTTLAQQVDDALTQERLLATLSVFFGGLAILLAMIGFYGVLAYLLLQRRKEIGIRMALGAQRGSILWLVMRNGAAILFAGACAGLAITWATTRFVQSLLFDIGARDAVTFVMSVALLAAVAFVASYLPARRAMRLDPMSALRHE